MAISAPHICPSPKTAQGRLQTVDGAEYNPVNNLELRQLAQPPRRRITKVFTFGREHEKKYATERLRDAFQIGVASGLIDAIHDFIEGTGSTDKVQDAIRIAFVEGHSGVWEATGSWLRKLGVEYPSLRGLWVELAQHPSAKVRFRIACHLNEMPAKEFAIAASMLSKDKSKKVVEMEDARIEAVAARANSLPHGKSREN